MAMVTTCDFMSNLNINELKNMGYNITNNKMNEFMRSQDFEKYIQTVLSENNEKNAILMLQYSHENTMKSLNHFIHIKHLIEKNMISHIKNKNSNNICYILLIVHLRRDTNKETFPLIFCKEWNIYFVDSLSQMIPFNLNSFANHTCLSIFEQNPESVLSVCLCLCVYCVLCVFCGCFFFIYFSFFICVWVCYKQKNQKKKKINKHKCERYCHEFTVEVY